VKQRRVALPGRAVEEAAVEHDAPVAATDSERSRGRVDSDHASAIPVVGAATEVVELDHHPVADREVAAGESHAWTWRRFSPSSTA
jgi:hypothetical protein